MFRPEPNISKTPSDKILINLIAYLAVVLFVVNGIEWFFNQNIIEPWLTKYKMLLLAAFGTLIAIGGNYLCKYPQHFNYRVEITEENAQQQYSKTVRALRWMLIIILSVMCGVSLTYLIQRVQYLPIGQHLMFLPVIVLVCFLFYFYLYFKAKKIDAKA